MRNPASINISLLEQTECTKFMYATEMFPKVHDLQTGKKDLQLLAVASLHDMLQGHSKHYPYEPTFAEARWNPVLILHSSGSTGTMFRP